MNTTQLDERLRGGAGSWKLRDTTFRELRRLSRAGTDGIVLLGAGGNPSEWIDGISKMLKDENVAGSEDPSALFAAAYKLKTSGGRTDIVLMFKRNMPMEVGKLAMWRLRFGDCSWVSDYLVNHASHFNESAVVEGEKPKAVEAYGVKGMKNVRWRKTFKSAKELNDWAEKNDAEVQGTRDVDESSLMVPAFADFVSAVREAVSPAESRRMAGLFRSEVEGFVDAAQSLMDAAIDDGFDARTVIEFMGSLAHKAAAKYEGLHEGLHEGRTPEQAYQKVWDALDDKAEINSSEWTTAARSECQKKGVKFVDFMEWVEAKDFAAMRESVYHPALLEAKVEVGVATVDHNGYSYEVKKVDSTHVSVRIPELGGKWIPYHIGQLEGALKDCALRVVGKDDRSGSPFVTSL